MLRLRIERQHGALQRQQAGVVDIYTIYLIHLGAADPDGDALRADLRLQLVALFGSELLGVVDADDAGAGLQDDRRRDHRTGERRHAHLVAAGDQRDALLPERRLEGAEAGEAPALGLGLVVALLDLLGHRARAG